MTTPLQSQGLTREEELAVWGALMGHIRDCRAAAAFWAAEPCDCGINHDHAKLADTAAANASYCEHAYQKLGGHLDEYLPAAGAAETAS